MTTHTTTALALVVAALLMLALIGQAIGGAVDHVREAATYQEEGR